MFYFTRWKALAIVLTALVVCLFAVPNFFPEETVKTWPKWAQRHIVLGLDLQGGSHILLEVDSNCGARRTSSSRCATTSAACCATPASAIPALRVRGDSVEVRIRGYRSAGRADQAARTVAAARRHPRRQRPAQPRRHRCRQRADPAHGAASRHHRPHPPVGRAVDPDHRTPRQRTRHRRAADPAPGHRPHSGAGAGPAGSDAPEGIARQDRQARLPHGRSRRSRRIRPCRAASPPDSTIC